MGRCTIGAFEHEVLSVLMLGRLDAYGAVIRQKIKEQTGRDPSLGAVYTTLERLEAKGFVSSSWGEATAQRGGKRKRYYKIEATGVDAARAFRNRSTAWFDSALPVASAGGT